MPLDKREGVVKRNFSWAVGEHRWLRPWLAKLRTKTQENLAIDQFPVEPIVPPTIDSV